MEQDIRIVYSAAHTQVRVSFTMEVVQEFRRPPKEVFKRAKVKLEDELSQGHIETFVIYEESFTNFWAFLREQPPTGIKKISFVVAQGYRIYKEIIVEQLSSSKEWVLSIEANPIALQKIGWFRFSGTVLYQLGLEPYSSPGVIARILDVWWRSLRGERIQKRTLNGLTFAHELTPTFYNHDKIHGTLFFCVNEAKYFNSAEAIKDLSNRLRKFIEKNTPGLSGYDFLEKECIESIRELIFMPESIGYGLPLCLPLAIKKVSGLANGSMDELKKGPAKQPIVQEVAVLLEKKVAKRKIQTTKSSDGLFEISVALDRLTAKITWADEERLQQGELALDKKWLEQGILEAGIRFGVNDDLDHILNLIGLKQSIVGQIVAQGIPAKPGKTIYLQPLFLEKNTTDQAATIEMRATQNRRIVDIGAVIAEYRYKDGKVGRDVYGKAIQAKVAAGSMNVAPGPGVERRADGRFYALLRGLPKLDRHSVSCLNVYFHKGDIDLTSGDLHFDGAVEIFGSIDSGAKVYAKGDLMVHGSLGRARVRCGGDLIVKKGIVSSREGLVTVGGDAYALFIENSRLIVEGRLEVEKSIINSDCKVGGEIVTLDMSAGLIGGGQLVAGKAISAGSLGFLDGEKTVCRVGSDWRIEHRLTILKGRDQKLKKFASDRQSELEALAKKRGAADRLAKIEKRLLKAQKIQEKLEKLIEMWRNRIRWNEDALLLVKGILDPNVEITIGGRLVKIQNSIREVMITANRYRDSYINALHFLEAYRKQRAAASEE